MGMSAYRPFIARQWLGKHVPAATKYFWRRRFVYGACYIKEKYTISSSQNFLFITWLKMLIHDHNRKGWRQVEEAKAHPEL
jgi:hypothetical protein